MDPEAVQRVMYAAIEAISKELFAINQDVTYWKMVFSSGLNQPHMNYNSYMRIQSWAWRNIMHTRS